ncbi:hypothetical protein BGV72_30465 [Burkholderia ubonensis]|uniref:hypothetical protein n=1 Tax=Burkholderia ubonensis TaxID=101571 RepID=UPI0007551891|nr:hypothetical protein [Burkholderia ubonensis]KVL66385.1 hypothetical protein WJ49_31985 [Burkholderia ubonensis]KVL68023.1 hypothetical protein WJ48_13270 [Burkholderia ubonensis]KVL83400.1 hypothetical protein WJ50_23755 [Burkholderia ubonensis]OJA71528.1 hypothetical protein BGV72_30465 [Burkholderia ubonensis]
MSFPTKESSRFWGSRFVASFYGEEAADTDAAARRRVANLQMSAEQRRAHSDRMSSFVINPNKEPANGGKRVKVEAIV